MLSHEPVISIFLKSTGEENIFPFVLNFHLTDGLPAICFEEVKFFLSAVLQSCCAYIVPVVIEIIVIIKQMTIVLYISEK